MNIGVAGHIRLLAALIDFMAEQTKQSPAGLEAFDLIKQIGPYMEPVIDYLSEESDGQFEERFKPVFGSGGPPGA